MAFLHLLSHGHFKKSFKKYLFLLPALGLNCGMWDLVPRPGIQPEFPTVEAWNLTHWTTREDPTWIYFFKNNPLSQPFRK